MWDTKYRPLKFGDVLGQAGSVVLLKARLRSGSAFDTSYIFAGGHGQGKTTLARIHARAMLCLQLNKEDPEPCNECDNCTTILSDSPGAFAERDAASQGTVENVRAVIEQAGFAIANARKRIELFDEAHRLGIAAQDAFLKPLEEKKLVAMFCTTELESIRGTIRSRCEEYTIQKVTRDQILSRMKYVLERENVPFEEDGVLTVVDHCGGHVRDVLNKLEMISQIGPVSVANVREYLHLSVVTLYYEILLSLHDPLRAVGFVEQACERAPVEDVVAGIAEAAMNSYRLANGMFAALVYVDRDMAKKVYEKYGVHTIRLADYFLTSRYASRVGLLRDVLLLTQQPGNLPAEGPQRPVVFVTQVGSNGTPIQAVPGALPAAVVTQAPSPQVPSLALPPPTPIAPSTKGHEILAEVPLTELDNKMNGQMPRQRQAPVAHPTFGGKPVGDLKDTHKLLHPGEWQREFERVWLPGRGADG